MRSIKYLALAVLITGCETSVVVNPPVTTTSSSAVAPTPAPAATPLVYCGHPGNSFDECSNPTPKPVPSPTPSPTPQPLPAHGLYLEDVDHSYYVIPIISDGKGGTMLQTFWMYSTYDEADPRPLKKEQTIITEPESGFYAYCNSYSYAVALDDNLQDFIEYNTTPLYNSGRVKFVSVPFRLLSIECN